MRQVRVRPTNRMREEIAGISQMEGFNELSELSERGGKIIQCAAMDRDERCRRADCSCRKRPLTIGRWNAHYNPSFYDLDNNPYESSPDARGAYLRATYSSTIF